MSAPVTSLYDVHDAILTGHRYRAVLASAPAYLIAQVLTAMGARYWDVGDAARERFDRFAGRDDVSLLLEQETPPEASTTAAAARDTSALSDTADVTFSSLRARGRRASRRSWYEQQPDDWERLTYPIRHEWYAGHNEYMRRGYRKRNEEAAVAAGAATITDERSGVTTAVMGFDLAGYMRGDRVSSYQGDPFEGLAVSPAIVPGVERGGR